MNYYQKNRGFNRPNFQLGPGMLSPFIKVVMIINLAVFIIQQIIPDFSHTFGFIPKQFFIEFPNLLYQPFTYMFLHGSFGHIFFNMFALWMFGTEIELAWGVKRFTRFYLIGGLVGALLTMIVKSSQVVPMVGASAAIYSVLVAYWMMFPNRQLLVFFVLPVKVKWAIPGFMLLGFLFGGTNVAHFAHLGGAIWGFLYLKSDLRFLSFANKVKEFKYKRQTAKFEKNRQKAEQVMKKVDDVLDRINEVGIENLTKDERKILEDASQGLSKEDQP